MIQISIGSLERFLLTSLLKNGVLVFWRLSRENHVANACNRTLKQCVRYNAFWNWFGSIENPL